VLTVKSRYELKVSATPMHVMYASRAKPRYVGFGYADAHYGLAATVGPYYTINDSALPKYYTIETREATLRFRLRRCTLCTQNPASLIPGIHIPVGDMDAGCC
jgi:hypothetical protein